MAVAAPGRAPFVVALTGGIAAGKSSVSARFERLGVPVIDTDRIARELVAPGQPLLASLIAAFGKELLDGLGRLRRRKLRELIFAHPDKRRQLEALLHPKIAEQARRRIATVQGPYCLLTIPLLAETGGRGAADRVLVVTAPVETRLRRLMARDQVSRPQAEAALAAQASDEARLALADDVIDNTDDLAALDARVAELHRRYTRMAESGRDSGSAPEG
jgi:dephospho-CoA kinase